MQRVKLLIAADPKVVHAEERNWLGLSPLHIAAEEGRRDMVDVLLARGADPNVKDSHYRTTPLHWAVQSYGDPSAVDLLLKHKADAGITNMYGETPLDSALRIWDERRQKEMT